MELQALLCICCLHALDKSLLTYCLLPKQPIMRNTMASTGQSSTFSNTTISRCISLGASTAQHPRPAQVSPVLRRFQRQSETARRLSMGAQHHHMTCTVTHLLRPHPDSSIPRGPITAPLLGLSVRPRACLSLGCGRRCPQITPASIHSTSLQWNLVRKQHLNRKKGVVLTCA